jgi:type VI secretion system protein ImpH
MDAALRLEGARVSDSRVGPITAAVMALTPDALPHRTAVSEALVGAALEERPTAFDFFQAVRLLERTEQSRSPVGEFAPPEHEAVRFVVPPSITYPASEIYSLNMTANPPRMAVNFTGLTGPLGILPYHYTLLVGDRVRARDTALQDFFSIFNHRAISLYYRAWLKNHFIVSYERDGHDRIGEHLRDLVGIGTSGLQNRLALNDETLMFYTGLLAPQPRSAVGLQQMLGDYFGVPVEVEQFVGGWYPLSVDTQCSLGDETSPSAQLGQGAVAGHEIWDQQARVRIRLGPLTRQQYDDFLPDGSAYEPLKAITQFFGSDQYEFEVQLVLARDEVPSCVLGAEGSASTPLGWCTWMTTRQPMRDPDDTCLTL